MKKKIDLSFIADIIDSHIEKYENASTTAIFDDDIVYYEGSINALEDVKEEIQNFIKEANKL